MLFFRNAKHQNPAGELFAMPLRPINLFDNSDEEESRFVAFYHRQPVDWNPQASDISAERSYIFSINFTCWEQQNEKKPYTWKREEQLLVKFHIHW
ncbi:Cytoplasmic tyrosine-protein kinase BMX [Trichinella spiralis]|uniref:Cytoplasmic tyrosine-protein kinase BMX n=1 Tax=Trichinella spiralis TaxID=6334 RepID=A0ABR3KM62_TRISP